MVEPATGRRSVFALRTLLPWCRQEVRSEAVQTRIEAVGHLPFFVKLSGG